MRRPGRLSRQRFPVPPAIFQPGASRLSGAGPELRLPSPGPSGGAAEPASTPRFLRGPPALTPLYLNRALQLEDSPIRVYGFIENSYNGDTNGMPATGRISASSPIISPTSGWEINIIS